MIRRSIMKRRYLLASALAILLVPSFALSVWATDAEIYFSSDKNGQNRVTKIQEGDEIWIAVFDPDEDIDCDVRDKIWTDVKVIDAKTGAHIVWKSYLDANGVDTNDDGAGDTLYGEAGYKPHKGHYPSNTTGYLGADYLEETNSSTGLFISERAFQIGTRVNFGADGRGQTHIVGPYAGGGPGPIEPTDFEWGNYLYADQDNDGFGDNRVWVNTTNAFIDATVIPTPPGNAYLPGDAGASDDDYILGRFENMDTVVGLYVDSDDMSDVAVTMGKIIDTSATISWGQEVYKDDNTAATITVVDPDENVSCNEVELIPVFIIVNPGSWNPMDHDRQSATNFCMLKRYGGVTDTGNPATVGPGAMVWHNIYDSGTAAVNLGSNQLVVDGTYYIQYPNSSNNHDGKGNVFDTESASGVTRVMFYAQETGADTGIFQLNLNSVRRDLGFKSLNVRDVLVAYYIDPNDQDDFRLSTAYIEERQHSITRFTNANRGDVDEFWIGRDPVYVEVIDANANLDSCCPEQVVVHICDPHEVDDSEWLILDETSSNSPIFSSNQGLHLQSVWDALSVGLPGSHGGYQLKLDNWKIEGFNEDVIYARYNDVTYTDTDMSGLGDANTETAFPPMIDHARLANDVSFDLMQIADTQVYDGESLNMYFLDRQGNRITGYVNSDCVFIEVIDPDQDEDQYRRERIDGFWDGTAGNGQNLPFAPWDYHDNHADCGFDDVTTHPVNDILGDTNIFENGHWAKLYVLNPRNGRWAAIDLLETGVGTGDFVSVTCIDLVNQYDCVPTLGVLPGDTLLAVYQDPSNHSDYVWIAIKVGVGGGGIPGGSTTTFVDESGRAVEAYMEDDNIYVKVIDSSHAGATAMSGAVKIADVYYDLSPLSGAPADTFITGPISLNLIIGDSIIATYTDPADPTDTSFDTIWIVSSELSVENFYAGPNPFVVETVFAYHGSGIATTFSIEIYDLSGHLVWASELTDVSKIPWNGINEDGKTLANGPYIYAAMATDGTNTFTAKGTVFINR
jgi:hypothetical protein